VKEAEEAVKDDRVAVSLGGGWSVAWNLWSGILFSLLFFIIKNRGGVGTDCIGL
jgi:hypothetical protein